MKITLTIILVLLLAGAGAALWWFETHKEPEEKRTLVVSGNMEITEVEVSFKVPGQVKSRLVSEGDMIKAGDVIALLDDTDFVLEVAARKADAVAAKAVLEEAENGYLPQEVSQAEAQLKQSEASLELATTDYNRKKQLLDQTAISPMEFDNIKTQYAIAQQKYNAAKEQVDLLKKGTRHEKVEQARARLEQATQAVAIAETKLSYTTLTSPISGFVLSQNIEAGEYVMPGTPIVTVGNLSDTWLRAYINETDLGLVKLGQSAFVTTDTYPNRSYEGTIAFISSEAEFTPKNIQTHKERVKLVYRIKIDIPNPNLELKAGMPADGHIPLR